MHSIARQKPRTVLHSEPPWKTSPPWNLCSRRGLTRGSHDKLATLVSVGSAGVHCVRERNVLWLASCGDWVHDGHLLYSTLSAVHCDSLPVAASRYNPRISIAVYLLLSIQTCGWPAVHTLRSCDVRRIHSIMLVVIVTLMSHARQTPLTRACDICDLNGQALPCWIPVNWTLAHWELGALDDITCPVVAGAVVRTRRCRTLSLLTCRHLRWDTALCCRVGLGHALLWWCCQTVLTSWQEVARSWFSMSTAN